MQVQERTEIRPFTPKPGAQYAWEVKSQLMKIVLVMGAYFLIQIVVAGIIETVIMFSSGLMDSIMEGVLGMAQGGGALDYDNLVESSTASAQEALSKHTGLIALVGAVASLPIFLLLRGKRMFTTDITEVHAPLSGRAFTELWVIAMGAQLIFDVAAALINKALESSGHSVTELLEQSMQMMQTPVGLLYVCLVGPIVEEIIFRGAVMRSLERFGLNFSIVISSLIFGLFHIFTIQAVFAFFMGLILGYIASRYSIKWSILAHILINSASIGISLFGSVGGGGRSFFSLSANLILILFLVGGIALLAKNRWRIPEQKAVGAPVRIPGAPENVGPALWRAAFTSIPLLIYIAATIAAGIAIILLPSQSLPI